MANFSPAHVVERWARDHRAAVVYRDLVRCGRCGFWSQVDASLCIRCGVPAPRHGSTASPDADTLVTLRRSRRGVAGLAGVATAGLVAGAVLAAAPASPFWLVVAAISAGLTGSRTFATIERRSLARAIVRRESTWVETARSNAPRAFESLRTSLQTEIDALTEQTRRLRGEARACERAGRGAEADRIRAALRRVEARWSQLRDELDRLDARLARNALLPWLVALRDGDLSGFEDATGYVDPGPLQALEDRARDRADAAGPRAKATWGDVRRLTAKVRDQWWAARADVAESAARTVALDPTLDDQLHRADAELDLLVDEALRGPYLDQRTLLAEAELEVEALLSQGVSAGA